MSFKLRPAAVRRRTVAVERCLTWVLRHFPSPSSPGLSWPLPSSC